MRGILSRTSLSLVTRTFVLSRCLFVNRDKGEVKEEWTMRLGVWFTRDRGGLSAFFKMFEIVPRAVFNLYQDASFSSSPRALWLHVTFYLGQDALLSALLYLYTRERSLLVTVSILCLSSCTVVAGVNVTLWEKEAEHGEIKRQENRKLIIARVPFRFFRATASAPAHCFLIRSCV